jgi:glycerophosphoryl diester phosphodiesterase
MKNITIILTITMALKAFANIQFIAHRGQSSTHPENSIQAIKAAVITGFEYIEIDIHRTKDDHIIAIHDEDIKRTTESKGKVIDLTLAQIKKVDSSIPTLSEVYELLEGSPSKLIIEIKNSNGLYPGLELETALLSKNYPSVSTIFKSFSRDSLDTINQFDSKLELLYVTVGPLWKFPLYIDDWLRFGSILSYEKASYIQVHRSFISKNFVNEAHLKKIKVIAWDVQNYDSFIKMKEVGVDLIETDHPPASLTLKPSFSK